VLEDDPPTLLVESGIAQGQLVVVFGSKGGVGTTVVAANVASKLAETMRTCLLDLDVGRGDIAGALDLRSGKTINPILDRLTQSDDALVLGTGDVLPSGLHVLAQPYELTELQVPLADSTRMLLRVVRRSFQMVVVDAGCAVQVSTLASLVEASEILLIATPDVPSIRNVQRTMHLFHGIGIAQERIRLVLNKVTPSAPLSAADVAEQLNMPVAAVIDRDDVVCAQADNLGRTLENVAPRAKVTQQMAHLWSRIHAAPGEKKGTSFLSFLPWRWAQG
jgi:pilus assembly protein CpaE